MIRLLLFPIFPRRAARALLARPVWWPGVLVLATMTVGTRLAEWPTVVQSVVTHLPPSASYADQEWVRSELSRDLARRCLMGIPACVGTVGLFAGLLHSMGRAQRFSRRPRFGHLFALASYAAMIPASVELAVIVLGAWTGTEVGIPRLAWAADMVGIRDFVLTALLEAVSLTAVWFVVVLGSGLSVLYACSFRRALLFAAGAWALAVVFNLWLLRIAVEALHLRV